MATEMKSMIRLPHLDQFDHDTVKGEAHLRIYATGGSGRVTGGAQVVFTSPGSMRYAMFYDFHSSESIRATATQKQINLMFSRWTSDEKKAELLAAVDAHYSKRTAAA